MERDTWRDPGSQMPIPVPIYSSKQVPAGYTWPTDVIDLREGIDLNKLFLEGF